MTSKESLGALELSREFVAVPDCASSPSYNELMSAVSTGLPGLCAHRKIYIHIYIYIYGYTYVSQNVCKCLCECDCK